MKDIDTDHRGFIVCPHCGYEEFDSWEVDFGAGMEGEIEYHCPACDKPMKARREVSVYYTTEKIEPEGTAC